MKWVMGQGEVLEVLAVLEGGEVEGGELVMS